jgi:microcystin-dependent protein
MVGSVHAFPRLLRTHGGPWMSDSYIGEVRLVGFNYAPVGWAFCNGAQLSISQYNTLYNLIGTTFGGNGTTVFNLPNLQGRIPIHQGSSGASNYTLGQTGGVEKVTLLPAQYPTHTHSLMVSSNSAANSTAGNSTLGTGPSAYSPAAPSTAMNAAMVGLSGSNGPHDNLQPYLVLNWIISLEGIYPSQT